MTFIESLRSWAWVGFRFHLQGLSLPLFPKQCLCLGLEFGSCFWGILMYLYSWSSQHIFIVYWLQSISICTYCKNLRMLLLYLLLLLVLVPASKILVASLHFLMIRTVLVYRWMTISFDILVKFVYFFKLDYLLLHTRYVLLQNLN